MKKLPNKVTLIGMSGVGKTSIGKTMSMLLKYHFFDTDTLIKDIINQPLQTYIQQNSESAFLDIEEQTILSSNFPDNSIISTGGSVIYSPKAMSFLKQQSTIVYLKDELENIKSRISSFKTRGIIYNGTSSFKELFNERDKLYKDYATITVSLDFPFQLDQQSRKVIQHISAAE